MDPRIIISTGFGQFPLREAAVETGRRENLIAFIAGGYPYRRSARCLRALRLSRAPAIDRFLMRAAPLPDDSVHALWAGELFYQLGRRIRGPQPLARVLADRADLVSRRLYSAAAAGIVRQLAAGRSRGIYHYRSGFGGPSVEAARERGWICLCHHTIAHPAVLQHLVAHGGNLPPVGKAGTIDRNWRAIRADVDRADHVLTESGFAKSTFVHQGWDPGTVDFIHQGIDDYFLAAIPERKPNRGPLRLMFAGSFCRRKGGPVLAEALPHLDDVDWRLDLCGPIDRDAAAAFRRLAADSRVRYLGNLSRRDLAARMAAADVFVFPTLAEGSARIQFEALAAGCYVITTPNGGSIVADGEHGRLVQPGSAREVVEALRHAAGDRIETARIGARNAEVMRRSYRQADFGARLADLYDRLLAE